MIIDDKWSLLTTREAAERLRLSPQTLEKMRVMGTGPRFVKLGRRVLYPEAELGKWAIEETKLYRSTSEYSSLRGRRSA